MVQGGVIVERKAISPPPPPSSPPSSRNKSDSRSSSSGYSDSISPNHHPHYTTDMNSNRMSVERTSDDEEMRSRASDGSGGKTPSPSMDTSSSPPPMRSNASPKSEGFVSSPGSLCGEDQPFHPRRRVVLDLSTPSAFTRKGCSDSRELRDERSSSFSRNVVPPFSPMSSSASNSSSGSPSATPEATKMDEVSIHDVAKEATDRRSRTLATSPSGHSPPVNVAGPKANAPEFDLQKNFYGYYVYQLELASRYSSSLRTNPIGSPDARNTTPLVGKVKPTMKNDPKDDEVVSYGSLLEQALRNGLKRSPSEAPASLLDKKMKTSCSGSSASSGSPSPASQPSLPSSQNSRTSSVSQVSVEDVAKNSLREMLHGKQVHDAGKFALSGSGGSSSQGSRSSSPSVNLKTLLETQSRESQLKTSPYRSTADLMAMSFANGFPKPAHMAPGGKVLPPHIYPHVLSQAGSPPRNGNDLPPAHYLPPHMPAASQSFPGTGYKHKKLVDWTACDVRDWIASLSYCSEFAEVFSRESVDGIALTLLNEQHLMKNFGMKLGPAIKLRCAVWEILGLCQAQSVAVSQPAVSQIPLGPHAFLPQKPIAVGHCIPQHHTASAAK